MTSKRSGAGGVMGVLESNHAQIQERAAEIIEFLKHLHHEGKISYQRRLGRVKQAVGFFDEEVLDHLDLEEEVLFPYLEVHLPKFCPAIRFLQAEHDDYRNNLKILKFLTHDLSRRRTDRERTQTLDRIKETGTYLAFLLRHHIEAEKRSIYHSLEKELHSNELAELKKKIRASAKHNHHRT